MPRGFVNLGDRRGRRLGRPLRVVVVGTGARGAAYAELVGSVGVPAEVVAIAEPRPRVRDDVGDRLGLPDEARLTSWQDLVDRPRLADLAIVATQDRDHVDPVVALADLGYDLLVEKPLAPTAEGIAAIVAAADRTRVTVAVCHVMRSTAYTRALLDLLRTGDLGEVMAVQHLEPIGWEHFAHSFVRGNWRRRDTSSFLLLAKSCHDLDWLHAVVDDEPVRVSSFGSLGHFRAEHRPDGAADRCVDCEVESDCPYSAARLYRRGLDPANASAHYFARIAVGGVDPTPERVESALRDGPWGRCVYDVDNDVVDHQVVAIEFAQGATVAFTLTAFTPSEGRRTRVFATHGQVVGDGRILEVTDFRSGRIRTIDTQVEDATAAGGHGGGDAGLVHAVLATLHEGSGEVPSGLAESLVSHRLAFAGDLARRESRVVELAELDW